MTRQVHRTARFAVRVRHVAAVALAASAAFSVAACSSANSDDKADDAVPTSVTPSPTASSDPEQAEKEAVLKAYSSMWAAQVAAYAKADPAGTGLDKYASGLALASTKSDLKDLKSKGIIATGTPGHDVDVTRLDLTSKVPKAKLTDCLDTSKWSLIYRTSGKAVAMPTARLTRYVNRIDAEKWGKQWRILNVTPEQQAC
ncbi:hypothetical protein [Streptomyces sasae]|uniref:hypothetical protein n=1 Tax=Streptomyces sasae TaxID=1266772 RepID=UPI0029316DA0|nr:hypothetical protein [Streptomyces sasae]